MATFRLERIIPVIERLIAELVTRDAAAARDAVVVAMMNDTTGKALVDRAKSKNTKGWTERQIAGNMVDWFSANYAVRGRLTESARAKFDRTKVDGKWVYFAKGRPFPVLKASGKSKPSKGPAKKAVTAAPAVPAVTFAFPRAFISYSHDSKAHKVWVERLAKNLVANGVDVSFDQWDLGPSADAAMYMERAVRDSDWVVVICTDKYVEKANKGMGGAGYEKMIMTAELVKNQSKKKFIPVVRTVNFPTVPTFLESKIYVDFTDDGAYAESVESLLRAIHSAPTVTKPSIGPNPFVSGGPGTPNII